MYHEHVQKYTQKKRAHRKMYRDRIVALMLTKKYIFSIVD